MGSPLYIKTYIMNIYAAILALMAVVYLIYNMVKFSNPSQKSVVAVACMPLLFIGIISDSVFDLIVKYDVYNFDDASLIVLTVVISLVAVLCILYMLKFHSLCRGIMKPDKNEDDKDENIYENMKTSGKFSDMLEHWGDWFERHMNINLSLNLIWGLGVYTVLLVPIYITRIISHNNVASIKETDVILLTLLLVGIMVPVVFFDYWKFQEYTGPIYMHYVSAGVIMLSCFMDFYGQVGASDLITLVAMLLMIALTIWKITAYNHGGKIPHYIEKKVK